LIEIFLAPLISNEKTNKKIYNNFENRAGLKIGLLLFEVNTKTL